MAVKKEFPRSAVVGEVLKKQLATHLFEVQNRLGLPILTLSDFELSPDMSQAKIFFSCLIQEEDVTPKEVEATLNDNIGEFRKVIADKSTRKKIPGLKFYHDDTVDQALEITSLLNKAQAVVEDE